LEIREDEHPIVYIDERVRDSRTWARTDPVFVSSVLPAIVNQIFDDILQANSEPDIPWMKDWLRWADSLMPGKKPPFSDGKVNKQQWIDDLLDTFSQRHCMLDLLLAHVSERGQAL